MMRVKIASIYNDNLSDIENIFTPKKTDYGHHVYHQYTISSNIRDKIMKKLEKNSIGSAIYYPVSLEKQKAFKEVYNDKTIYKNSNYLSSSCLSLPIYPHLPEDEVHKICEVIKNIK
jgi:dTDP-4-amino-4,6-dideoxygalactose transaminase